MNYTSSNLVFSTFIVSIFSKKWNLDNLQAGMLTSMLVLVIETIKENVSHEIINEISNIVDLQSIILLLVTVLIFYLIYKYVDKFATYFKLDNEITIKLYDPRKLDTFLKYFDFYPDIIKNDVGINYGNLDLILDAIGNCSDRSLDYETTKNRKIPKLNVKIYYEDYNLDISGYISWKSHKYLNNKEIGDGKQSKSQKIEFEYFYPVINIKLNKKSKIKFGHEYFNEIQKIVDNKINECDKVFYVKIFKDENNREINYLPSVIHIKDEIETQEQCDKIWIDSFFSNAKDAVWNHVKKIHYEPEKIQKYGQTPRASYIFHGEPGTGKSSFVTRMAISLKRHIVSLDLREIKSKSDIYRLFDHVYIQDLGEVPREKCIFLLDEFDLALRSLEFKDKLKKKYYDNLFSDKNNELENKKYNTETERQTIKKDKFDDINECDFTVSDLVEIFQGSYPLDGLILIAITNDFNGIQKICPKLFRNGRMTPIEFTKMDIMILNQLSIKYFNRKLDFTFDGIITSPSSTIIELAMLHIGNFDSFNKALKEIIEDNNITCLEYPF